MTDCKLEECRDGVAGADQRRPLVLHPAATAIFPVLALFAENAEEVPIADVVTALVAAMVLALSLYCGLWRLLRDRHRAGLIATTHILLLYLYGSLHKAAELSFSSTAAATATVILVVVTVLILLSLFFARAACDLRNGTRLANGVAGLAVGLAVLRIATTEIGLLNDSSISAADCDLAFDERAAVPADTLPDIYYVVLDRYASDVVLETAYNFSNDEFSDALREKGFHVVRDARCNYARTSLSLWSSLNLQHHPREVDVRKIKRSLRKGHVVGRTLTSIGYQYIHIGSWYGPTATCRQASVNIRAPQSLSPFHVALLKMTPLLLFGGNVRDDFHARIGLFQFEAIERASKAPGPKFVFAHILLPHPPFVFDRHGSRIAGNDESSKRHYLEQLRFTNVQILSMVDRIVANSERPPIIVIQGDEGPFLRGDDAEVSPREQLSNRTGILNAYYCPGMAHGILDPQITPVNTFRHVFKNYLGLDVQLVDDTVFQWDGLRRPFAPKARIPKFSDATDMVRNTNFKGDRIMSSDGTNSTE